MLSLLIETATERGIVAVLESDRVLFKKELPYGTNSAKLMPAAIQEGLQLLGLIASNLSFVAAGVGPGSFTGIRVAAAAAQSIAYAVKIPVIGIPTLACFSPDSDGPFAVCIDAKIGGVYIMTAKKLQSRIVEASVPMLTSIEEAAMALKEFPTIVTPNSSALRPKLEKIWPDATWSWEELAPDPVLMGNLAHEKLLWGQAAKHGALDLLYLRKSQAEEAVKTGSKLIY